MPTYFKPQFQKHRGTICGGVELVVTDAEALQPYRLGVGLLQALRRVAGEAFSWRRAPYEFVVDRPAIDLLTGSAELRSALEADDEPRLKAWIASWTDDEQAFRSERRELLLYPEGE